MFLEIKTKQSVNVENMETEREVIMSKFSKEYIGDIKRIVRDVDNECLEDYGYANKGITKGKLFMPALDFNTITIYFNDDTTEPMTIRMSANKEYTLKGINGSVIEELHPYGYIINEIPSYDEMPYLD